MAQTVETVLGNTWVKVINDGVDYVLQSNGSFPINVFWKDTQPDEDDFGILLLPGHGINSGTFLQGNIWARCPNGVGRVAVNI